MLCRLLMHNRASGYGSNAVNERLARCEEGEVFLVEKGRRAAAG